VDPEKHEVTVRWGDGEKVYSDPENPENIASKILPDLKIKVCWIWQRDGHPTDEDFNHLLGKMH
jgi:hypothetical protein